METGLFGRSSIFECLGCGYVEVVEEILKIVSAVRSARSCVSAEAVEMEVLII